MSTRTESSVGTKERRGEATSRPTAAWPLVAKREMHVKLHDRNFLVGTGLFLVLLLGVILLQGLLSAGTPDLKVGVTDNSGADIVAQAQGALRADDAGAKIAAVTMSDQAAGEAAVKAGDVDALLTQVDGTWTLMGDGEVDSGLQGVVSDAVRTTVLAENATEAGTTVPELVKGTELSVTDLSGGNAEERGLALIMGFVFAMLFYMSALMFGMTIANSVVEEKQSRIVEILAAAIPVRQLLIGKVVGNTVLALAQMALIVGIGLIGVSLSDLDLSLAQVAPAAAWYVLFFLAGFLALACMWAAAGALASRTEDLQSTTTPLTMVLVGAFVIGLNLHGAAQVIGSYVPVMSTILMPIRLLNETAAWWEPVLSLLITLAFCALTIAAGTRLYRRALLKTQGRVSLRAAWGDRD